MRWFSNERALAASFNGALNARRYDWLYLGATSWLMGGLFLDGWAHGHRLGQETFFTPWHAVLYSGFLVVASVLLFPALSRGLRQGTWRAMLPKGYGLSLVGIALFAAGGVGDFFWHLLFGIETDLAALLSPTHLLLAGGLACIVGGPFRAAWHRPAPVGALFGLLPALCSLAFSLSILTFLTEFSHPYVLYWAAPSPGRIQTYGALAMSTLGAALGITGIELQSGLLMAMLLLLIRRWQLPFGALTVFFVCNTALLVTLNDHYILLPAGTLTGLCADLLQRGVKSAPSHLIEVRLFAFLVPLVWMILYFLVLLLTEDITWSIHLWAGSIVIAGLVGLLMSYLAFPVPVPAERTKQERVAS